MRILVLGGTQFLGRAIAAQAIAQGHAVTCAARGITGQPPPGAQLIPIDRDAPDGLAPLAHEAFDAVVDVGRHPGQVRAAIAALRHRVAHWTFISTISVYADNATPGQGTEAALLPPTPPEVEHGTPATYGPAKVACEQATGDDALIVRAGLIVGPEDPTGRFTYWPLRLARGGEVLVPSPPDEPVQVVDVRDLAAWIVRAVEGGLTGPFNATSFPFPRRDLLAACAHAGSAWAVGTDCTFVWTDAAFLESQDVRRWSGPRSLPLWMPGNEFAGFNTRSVAPARLAGLTFRPLADTARDTLAWARATGAEPTGLTPAEEAAILAAWHARLP